jgi:hypothetical protein
MGHFFAEVSIKIFLRFLEEKLNHFLSEISRLALLQLLHSKKL